MKKIIEEKLSRTEDLNSKGFHKNAIEEALSVLESVLRLAYKETIVSLSLAEKKELIKIEEEVGEGKSIEKMMIGQLIGIFEKVSLYKKYTLKKGINPFFFTISNLRQINTFRVKCTHEDYIPTENEAKYVEYMVKNIIDELQITPAPLITTTEKEEEEEEEEEEDIFEDVSKRYIHFNNLPRPEYIEFIGRRDYIEDVIKYLTSRAYIISIDGIGGVGKSALALEVGKKCWNDKLFDAVIWTSAKTERLKIVGIEDIVPSLTSFESLLDTIISAFGFKSEEQIEIDEKKDRVNSILQTIPTLLIVDNLETIDDPDIFSFLKDLPDPSKALITSRKRLGEVERIVQLKEFSIEETRDFLELEFRSRGYSMDNFEERVNELHEMTGGIPLALKIIAGWLSERYSIEKIKDKITGEKSQITKFCFEECYNNLMDDNSRRVFCIFPILLRMATKDQIIVASQLDEEKGEAALQKLIHLSLVNREDVEIEKGIKETCYSMLPLTLAFAHEKLTKNRGLEREARRALGKYFEQSQMTQDALKQYGLALEDLGGQTEKGRMSAILANLAFATFQRGNYKKATEQFKRAVETDPKLSYSYQLWATMERQQGNYSRAEELFKKASELNPNNSIIWSSWAMMKKDTGDLMGAKTLLEMAQKKRKNPFISQQLAVVKSMLGNFDEASAISLNSLNKEPRSKSDRLLNTFLVTSLGENYWKWGLALQRKRELDSAEEKMEEGIKIIEDNLNIVYRNNWKLMKQGKKLRRGLGIIKRKKFDYDGAEECFKLSLYERPRHIEEEKHNCRVQLDRLLNLKYWDKTQEMYSLAEECVKMYEYPRFIEYIRDTKIS